MRGALLPGCDLSSLPADGSVAPPPPDDGVRSSPAARAAGVTPGCRPSEKVTAPVHLLYDPSPAGFDPIREAKVSQWIAALGEEPWAGDKGLACLEQFLEAARLEPGLGRDLAAALVASLQAPTGEARGPFRILAFLLGQSCKHPELAGWLSPHGARLATVVSSARRLRGEACLDDPGNAYRALLCHAVMKALPHLVDERFLAEEVAPLLHSADGVTASWGGQLLETACELHRELVEPASELAVERGGSVRSWKWVLAAAGSMAWKPTREQALSIAAAGLRSQKQSRQDEMDAPIDFAETIRTLHQVEQHHPGHAATLAFPGPAAGRVTHALLERVRREAPDALVVAASSSDVNFTSWESGRLLELVRQDRALADHLLDEVEKAYTATPDLNRMRGEDLACLAVLHRQDLSPDQAGRLKILHGRAAAQKQGDLRISMLVDAERRRQMAALEEQLGRGDLPPGEQFSRLRDLVLFRYCQLPFETEPALTELLDRGMPGWMPELGKARPHALACLHALAATCDPKLGVEGLPWRQRADLHVLGWLAWHDPVVLDAAEQVVASWPEPAKQVAAEPVLEKILFGGRLQGLMQGIRQESAGLGARVHDYLELAGTVHFIKPEQARAEVVRSLRKRGFESPLEGDEAYLRVFDAVARHAADAPDLEAGWKRFHDGLAILGGEAHLEDAMGLHDHVEALVAGGTSEESALEAGLGLLALGRRRRSVDVQAGAAGSIEVDSGGVTIGGLRIPRRSDEGT